jgi:uncharacterized protein
MEIEIAYATPTNQTIVKIAVAAGTTIQEAILQSDILNLAAISEPIQNLAVGIFGKQRSLSWELQEGDRVEIYRPLYVDPKTARKIRAKKYAKNNKDRK